MSFFGGLLKVAGIAGSVVTGNPAIAVGAFAVANQIDKGKKKSGFDQALDVAGSYYATKGNGTAGGASQATLLGSAFDLARDKRDEPPAYEPSPGYAAFDAYSRPAARAA